MDIPEKDPNKSDEDLSEQIPDELPIEDPASNMEDDVINQANLELLRLSLTEDRTPTDPGTGEALFAEPPPIPRIKELRSEILTSPPVRRRSSRKLDFPPEVSTPKNSPENKSPKVTSDNPSTFGKELYESMPGSSAEVVKRRLSLTNPVNPFLLVSRRRHSEDQSAQSPNLGLGRGHTQGKSAQSPNLGLGGSHSQGQAPLFIGLRRRHSGDQSTQSPIPGLGRSQGQFPFLIGVRKRHNEGQSAQSPNLELVESHSEGLFPQSTNPGLGGGNNQGQSPFLTGLRRMQHMGQSAQNPSLGGSHSRDQSAQSPTLGLGESHSQSPSIPNLELINTAAQCFTRNIMSDAIPESLSLSPNVQPPTTPQAKRSLDRSPSESGSSGSPSVVKRHRRIPSSVPEDHPAAHVQRRRSHEFRRNEPEVRREPRKRSYSSGLDETKGKQQKKD